MAHELSFLSTSNLGIAAQTITVPGTNYFLINYQPITARQNPDGTYEDVTETIEVMFTGSTVTVMRDAINTVERFLVEAKNRQKDEAGVRYYFRFKPDGDLVAWRSELLGGRVELGRNALQAYGQAKMEARIIITRRHYWEGNTAEIPLASNLDTVQVLGVRIKNHRDTSNSNHVEIASTAITGVLPSPLWIRLKNTSGSSQAYRNWYISNNVWNSPSSFTWEFQGENAVAGYGTDTVLATCSNGQYNALPVNLSSAIPWLIDGGQTERAAGYDFRVLMRMPGAIAQKLYITPSIWASTNLALLTPFPKEVAVLTTASRLVDLGTLQIPPGLGNDSAQAGVHLRLDVRAEVSTNLSVDYIQIFPAYNFRHLVMRGNTIPNNDSIYDNPIEESAYSEENDGDDDKKHAIITPLENPILAWPGRVQKLYFLHDVDTGDAPIATQTTVQAFYRPRLLTI